MIEVRCPRTTASQTTVPFSQVRRETLENVAAGFAEATPPVLTYTFRLVSRITLEERCSTDLIFERDPFAPAKFLRLRDTVR